MIHYRLCGDPETGVLLMAKITKSSSRRRLEEAQAKLMKCYFSYHLLPMDKKIILKAHDDLTKVIKKLK